MRRAVVTSALSLACGLVFTVAAYAILRSIQFFLFPDPNPATLVWSAHSGYFWRIWTVAYAGGIASFVVALVAREHLRAVALALRSAITVAAVLLALEVAFLP